MLLLRLIEFAIVICVGWLLLTQLVMPLIFGLKFFPMFRNTELKQKVDATRDEVADLKDQTVQLTELELLLKQKHDLEVKIAEINKPKE
jgi:hypothetical protein